MKLKEKNLSRLLVFPIIGSSLLLSYSCVDSNYDLDNLDKNMSVGSNLTIPIGSTKQIKLGDLLEDVDILDVVDGKYKISMGDTIEYEIDKIAGEDGLSLEANETKQTIHQAFESPSLPSFQFETPATVIDVTPAGLTKVNIGSGTSINNTISIGVNLPNLPIAGIPISNQSIPVSLGNENTTEINVGGGIECPAEVNKVTEVKFGNDANGAVATATFDLSAVASLFGDDFKVTMPSAKLTFPEGFVLENGKNVIEKTNLVNNGNKIEFTFRIVKYNKEILRQNNGQLTPITGVITYDISPELTVSGTTSGKTASSNNISLNTNATLDINDMTLSTNNIGVAIPTVSVSEETEIKNIPTAISNVEKITLDPTSNKLNIKISAVDIAGLSDVNNSSIAIKFPKNKFTLTTDAGITSDATHYSVNIPTSQLLSGNDYVKVVKIEEIILTDSELKEVVAEDGTKSQTLIFNPEITIEGADLSLGGETTLNEFNSFIAKKQQIEATVVSDKLKIKDANLNANDYIANIENNTNKIELTTDVPKELVQVDSITFENKVNAALNIAVELKGSEAELSFENYVVEFPKFIVFAPESGIVDNKLVLHDPFTKNGTKQTYQKSITIDKLDFSDPSYNDMLANGKLNIDDAITLGGTIKLSAGGISSEGVSIDGDIDFKIDEMVFSKIYGEIDPELPSIETSIDLSDLSESFEGELSATLNNPSISLTAQNSLAIPIEIASLKLQPYKDGVKLDPIEASEAIVIAAANGDVATESKIVISANDAPASADASIQYIKMESIKDLLKELPDKIELEAKADVQKVVGQNHMVDLNKDYNLDLIYSVDVPLAFDDLSLAHQMVVETLNSTIEPIAQMTNKVELVIETTNTLPINLTIDKITPLDKDGNALTLPDMIESGSNTIEANGTSTLKIALTDNDTNDLERLDGLDIAIKATIDHTEGGAALAEDQYIQLKIKVNVPEGIEIDLDDME